MPKILAKIIFWNADITLQSILNKLDKSVFLFCAYSVKTARFKRLMLEGGATLIQRPIETRVKEPHFRRHSWAPCTTWSNKFGIKLKLVLWCIYFIYLHMVLAIYFFRNFAIQKNRQKRSKIHHSDSGTGSCSNPPHNSPWL